MKRVVACAALLLASVFVVAEDPKQAELKKMPQRQRKLTGEDEKRVVVLKKRIAESISKNDYTNAIQLLEEVIALRSRIQGDDHYSTIDERQYGLLLSKIGKFDEDERRAWRDTLKLEVAAIEHMKSNRNEEALAAYRSILDARTKLIGDAHPEIARILTKVAVNLSALKRQLESRSVFQKALEIDRKVLGDRNPKVANGMQNLALVLNGIGSFTESEVLYRSAIEILKDTEGESSLAIANCEINLAGSLSSQRRYADAHSVLTKAMTDLSNMPDGAGPVLHVAHDAMASTLMVQGRADESQIHFRQAYKLAIKLYGFDSDLAARSRQLLIAYLENQKHYEEAELLLRVALNRVMRRFGESHPRTAIERLRLGSNHAKQNRYSEARTEFELALAIIENAGNGYRAILATCLNNLAANFDREGKPDEALEYLRKALATYEQADTVGIDDIASAIANIATVEYKKQNYVAALHAYQDARKRLEAQLGARHPDVLDYSHKVALCL